MNSRHIRLVFSYAAIESLTAAPQSISLRCAAFGDRDSAEAAMLSERDTDGRQAHSRLCKPNEAAIMAKIAEFVESMERDYSSLDGKPAIVTVEKILADAECAVILDRYFAEKFLESARAELVDSLNECVQVRCNPALRVVIWAEDGASATHISYADSMEQAEGIRASAIAERLAHWDAAMATATMAAAATTNA